MNMFFDWWFATSLRLRQLCWAVWLLVLVTLIFLSSTHQEERDALGGHAAGCAGTLAI